MPEYTTGEIAKLCGVSVRTIQYYDSRGILAPSGLSEGGRRLYSEEDVAKMKIICFLRELGLSINSIKELLTEERSGEILSILLTEQEKKLKSELEDKELQLKKVTELKQLLKKDSHFTISSIGDMAYVIENKEKLKKTRFLLIPVGIAMDIVEICTLIYGIMTGKWLPFALGMCFVFAAGALASAFYYKRTAYICGVCHTVFRPAFRKCFFAHHTPDMRKLTCTACRHHGFCVEIYKKENQNNHE